MSMIYEKFTSSAIKSVETLDNTVKVVYNSNINKEYEFNCQNIQEFVNKLSETLIAHEELLEGGSVGKFINQSIKSGVLVENK
jgi:hypothetical protein|tara:strand:- start:819 stop:1067 length:249 start_codon:yes stop_codon:yes gene_type:complete